MQTVTIEQMVKVMEATGALTPEAAVKVREALSGGPGHPERQPGFTFVRESEREWYGDEVCELALESSKAWSQPSFHPKKWLRAARESVRKLREAQAESAFGFLLRKGVQTLANDWYITIPSEWRDYAQVASSNGYGEWYAPLYGSVIAKRVPRGERYPEGRTVGEDSLLVNYKFGLVESFDRELFDDDQTGQIRERATRLGMSMALAENVYAAIRFIGSAGSYAGLDVPASNYTTTNTLGAAVTGPWSATLYGAAGNRPSSYAALGLTVLKAAWSGLLNARDPLNNKIITRPDTLLVSDRDALHAPMLVSPPAGVPYYPAPIGLASQTAATAASGSAGGGVFGANPFLGLGITPRVIRFLAEWAWALGEKGKGFVFQERDPLEVIQEVAGSGASFEVDGYRFRSRRRFEADWIGGGSRFWHLGNDGTVAGSF